MKQKNLFETDEDAKDSDGPEPIAICSGRIGPICFGSTDTSYTLTAEVLSALTTPSSDAADKTD